MDKQDFIDKILFGDCLEVMPQFPSGIFDLILCDLPYQVTARNEWDVIIPMEPLWTQYKRLIKPNGAIVLTSQGMFSAMLMMSASVRYQYSAVWCKHNHTNQLNAKRQLLRKHEDILIFYDNQPTYNPQGLVKCSKITKQGKTATTCYGDQNRDSYFQEWTNWPTTLIQVNDKTSGTHPTEKPSALIAFLVKTFSNEGDLILDNAAGSCTLAVVCKELDRHFVCIENDKDIYAKAVLRFKHVCSLGENLF